MKIIGELQKLKSSCLADIRMFPPCKHKCHKIHQESEGELEMKGRVARDFGSEIYLGFKSTRGPDSNAKIKT